MTDIVDTATRKRMMAAIRGKNTKLEILVRSLLHRKGLRFRKNVNSMLGKPDIVLPRFVPLFLSTDAFGMDMTALLSSYLKLEQSFGVIKLITTVPTITL